MFSSLVIHLLESFDSLDASCQLLASSMREDAHLPLVLFGSDKPTCRKVAISAITRLYRLDGNENIPLAGIVCASHETIEYAHSLNEAKRAFQTCILEFRNETKSLKGTKNAKLDRLVKRVLHQEGVKSDDLALALKRARLTDLDLLRCYAKVRILPANLGSVSWTWAKTHSAIESVSLADALEMATHLNDDARALAERLLTQLPPGTKLALKKKLPDQLRANLIFFDAVGLPVRQSVTFSGVALSSDPTLPPSVIWRENTTDSLAVRKERMDAAICPEPYIQALHLHLYTGDKK